MTDKMTAEQQADASFYFRHEFWQLSKIDDGRVMLFFTEEMYERVRQALTAPRVPDIGGHLMNECAWAFIEAMPDGADRGTALTSTWLKPALHAAITTLLTAAQAPAEPEPLRFADARLLRRALQSIRLGDTADADKCIEVILDRSPDFAAPAPADVTLTNEGDIGQVSDSDEIVETAQDKRCNFGASFSQMPAYEYQRQISTGDARISAMAAPAPAEPKCKLCNDSGYVGSGQECVIGTAPCYMCKLAGVSDAMKTAPAPADETCPECGQTGSHREGCPDTYLIGYKPADPAQDGLASPQFVELTQLRQKCAGQDAELAKLRERVKVEADEIDEVAETIMARYPGMAVRLGNVAARLRGGSDE